jgi:hypothetical protein
MYNIDTFIIRHSLKGINKLFIDRNQCKCNSLPTTLFQLTSIMLSITFKLKKRHSHTLMRTAKVKPMSNEWTNRTYFCNCLRNNWRKRASNTSKEFGPKKMISYYTNWKIKVANGLKYLKKLKIPIHKYGNVDTFVWWKTNKNDLFNYHSADFNEVIFYKL